MKSESFLSESVRTLLSIAGSTAVTSDQSNIYLASRYSFNWDNIASLLRDSTGEQELSELAQRSSNWFQNAICALTPVLDTSERLCHKIATTDSNALSSLRPLWEWTGSAEELSAVLCECFSSSSTTTSAVESTLVISAILERAFGDILRTKHLPVPFLLRDLLLEQPLYNIFGDVALQFTRMLVGMPLGLNARNLVWHGFVSPHEMPKRVPATLLILLSSLGDKLSLLDVPLPIPLPKRDTTISGLDELPETSIDSEREAGSSISALTIIPSRFLPFWEASLQRFSEGRFGRCLVLLLPQLELVLRLGFCFQNDCPRRLLTAVQSSPHTTLDDMLVETVDGVPNALCGLLGDGLLDALFDLLQRPAGPRIRDRLGHGECALDAIPRNLAEVVLSVSFATATRLSKLASDPFCQLSFWENYTAVFHPSSLFFKSAHEVLNHVEKIDACVESASALIDVDQTNCDSLLPSLGEAFSIGDVPLDEARKHSNAKAASLFRPRNEILATTALWRALRSLCVALVATCTEMRRRSSDVAAGRLRSRQRKTFQRMIQIAPTLSRNSVCFVVVAVRIRNAVAASPEDYPRWRRCIDHMEKYTEKLASYAHTSKNRWEEIQVLISNFCKTAATLV